MPIERIHATVGCRSLPMPIESRSGDAATIDRICAVVSPSPRKNSTFGRIVSATSYVRSTGLSAAMRASVVLRSASSFV